MRLEHLLSGDALISDRFGCSVSFVYFSEVLGKRYIERKMKPGYINTEVTWLKDISLG